MAACAGKFISFVQGAWFGYTDSENFFSQSYIYIYFYIYIYISDSRQYNTLIKSKQEFSLNQNGSLHRPLFHSKNYPSLARSCDPGTGQTLSTRH